MMAAPGEKLARVQVVLDGFTGVFAAAVNDPLVGETFSVGCVNGNFEQANVTNPATSAFSSIAAYSFK